MSTNSFGATIDLELHSNNHIICFYGKKCANFHNIVDFGSTDNRIIVHAVLESTIPAEELVNVMERERRVEAVCVLSSGRSLATETLLLQITGWHNA